MAERLQKVLAHAGVASRRAAEQLVLDGRVAVNGEVVRILGTRVDLTHDAVTLDGQPLADRNARSYFALHKPRGYVSTARDERGRPTVLDLVPSPRRLYPVGRLDVDSEGLVLLTDDGDLALHLTHPRYGVPKEYRALVDGVPSAGALAQLRLGVALTEGRTAPAEVEALHSGPEGAWLRIVLRQGWNRQVRRMLDAVGHPARRLVRTRIGSLELGHLRVGQARTLRNQEIARLRQESGLPATSPRGMHADG
jgi:23S rRNA pseudouridine2605 synthase